MKIISITEIPKFSKKHMTSELAYSDCPFYSYCIDWLQRTHHFTCYDPAYQLDNDCPVYQQNRIKR